MEIERLKGVGPKTAAQFRRLGIATVEDLLLDWPVRYEDRETLTSIADLEDGALAVIMGRLEVLRRPIRLSGHRSLLRAQVSDAEDATAVVWHNQPYRGKSLREGETYYFYGTYLEKNQAINDPVVAPVSDNSFLGFAPVYRLTEGLSNARRIRAVREALRCHLSLDDPLPACLRERAGLMPFEDLVQALHLPSHRATLVEALSQREKREALEDALIRRLLLREREQWRSVPMRRMDLADVVRRLPFSLTATQCEAVDRIVERLVAPTPMNLLLQGDVGSGKTVVALLGAALVMKNGYSVAFMAPTEVLATQHAKTAAGLFGEDRVHLITGSATRDERERLQEKAQTGRPDLFVGTHALFQESLHFSRLGLVMTDEQHRFGVEQRGRLQAKLTESNTLVLSATPIPRTMTLVDWGDLELVRLTGRPPGRHPVVTRAVDARSERAAIDGILRQVNAGHRAYVVCPLIEPGESDLKRWSVEETAERIRRYAEKKAPGVARVGVLTGPMPAEEKERVFDAFKRGKINILVSTTVIEVGVDVPEATVMLVMAAERFGLAQLHQLRGRVGRGSAASYCVFLAASPSKTAIERLRFLETTADGWDIARKDLELRGAGARLGTAQHGLSVESAFALSHGQRQRWADGIVNEVCDALGEKALPLLFKESLREKVARLRHVTLN
ncbi:MAG: helicase-related protein [Peptoniphilaceae bacterium]|nr:helicase-related protein [Peptoniphilaceae bacterium]